MKFPNIMLPENKPFKQGDLETTEAFDQAAKYWKQATALTPDNYIEVHNWLKIMRCFE